MESKTKHRILGVLVIIGLGVLAYPLLQSGDEVPSEKVLVKAPPFPDQSTPTPDAPVSAVAPVDNPSLPSTEAAPLPDTPESISPSSGQATSDDEGVQQQPDDTINNTNQPNVVNVKAPELSTVPTPDAPAATTTKPVEAPAPQPAPEPEPKAAPAPTTDGSDKVSLSDTPKPMKAVHAKAKTVAKKLAKAAVPAKTLASATATALNLPKHDDNNGLLKLNQAVWVIQVGSFENKTKALQFVNSLRENGYRAFIQSVPSSEGDMTQVFVGPENRQQLARSLAAQLNTDMNVKGIVVSYQPFVL